MALLRVSLLGRFCVRAGNRIITEFEKQKVQELFCFLILNRTQSHTRESLASRLWGQTARTQSKRYLRKTLWQLQAPLERITTQKKQPYLLVGSDWIQINPAAEFWLDVGLLESAFFRSRGIEGRNLTKELAHYLKQCVKYYRGDLLEGLFSDWCIFERERIQRVYLILLDKLLDYCIANADYETGLMYGSQLLRFDIAHERTHRQLMRLYYFSGDRTLAIRQYEFCVSILERELNVTPTKKTKALLNNIIVDNCSPDFLTRAVPLTKQQTQLPINETLIMLKQLQAELSTLQNRVNTQLSELEQLFYSGSQ
ncbi:MAG: hypothetical protein GY943_26120 [Chloroflexi bacterium]|nr:hypothetical protein [Chloroflexota bacterium]